MKIFLQALKAKGVKTNATKIVRSGVELQMAKLSKRHGLA